MGFNAVTCGNPFIFELTTILGPGRGSCKEDVPVIKGGSCEFLRGGSGDINLLLKNGGCNPFRGGGVNVDLDDGGSNLAGERGIGGIGILGLISTLEALFR